MNDVIEKVRNGMVEEPTRPELRRFREELEKLSATDLNLGESQRRGELYAGILVRLGEADRVVEAVERIVDKEPSLKADTIIWCVAVSLLDAPKETDFFPLVNLLRHAEEPMTGGLLVKRLLEHPGTSSEEFESREELGKFAEQLYEETGIRPLRGGLDGFRAVFELYRGDRNKIDAALTDQRIPEFDELETSFWREKLRTGDVRGLSMVDEE